MSFEIKWGGLYRDGMDVAQDGFVFYIDSFSGSFSVPRGPRPKIRPVAGAPRP